MGGKKNPLHMIAYGLMAIGGLNWLVFGLFSWDVGMLLGGMQAPFSRVIYVVVGLATVYELVTHKKMCMECDRSKSAGSSM